MLQESNLVCELFPVIIQLLAHNDMLVACCASLTLWNIAREPVFRYGRWCWSPSVLGP